MTAEELCPRKLNPCPALRQRKALDRLTFHTDGSSSFSGKVSVMTAFTACKPPTLRVSGIKSRSNYTSFWPKVWSLRSGKASSLVPRPSISSATRKDEMPSAELRNPIASIRTIWRKCFVAKRKSSPMDCRKLLLPPRHSRRAPASSRNISSGISRMDTNSISLHQTISLQHFRYFSIYL
jgi:hypothetical protein